MHIVKELNPIGELQAMLAEMEISKLRKSLDKAQVDRLEELRPGAYDMGMSLIDTMELMVKVARESKCEEISMLLLNLTLLMVVKPQLAENVLHATLSTISKQVEEMAFKKD